MKAIIIAENSQCRLSPLTDRTPHALLPVAGKTILMHALETLHRSAIFDVTVVSPTYCAKLATEIDTGPLIGMDVRFTPMIPEGEKMPDHVLMIGLKDIVDADWDDVLHGLGDLKVHALMPIRMTVCAEPVALVLSPGYRERIPSDWGDVHLIDAIHLPIGPKRVMSTATLRDYHQSNFHLLRGEFEYLKPAGREYASGHRTSPKARVNAKSIQSDHGYFGAHCRVDKTARLHGDVIIGDRVVVGKGANVRDSIIFDRTYVGSHTDCSDAIIDGNLLIKVDTGVTLLLDDPVLFGAIA
jgi:hypothetical protein